jgi:hypothetical protein
MVITLKKFGTTLISRPAGKEAFLAIQPLMRELKDQEKIEVDCEGVMVLTPSWADEFITPFMDQYPDRVTLSHTENPSVKASLETLRKAKQAKA